MKDKTRAQIASLTQTRDTLVKQRTALKNKINQYFFGARHQPQAGIAGQRERTQGCFRGALGGDGGAGGEDSGGADSRAEQEHRRVGRDHRPGSQKLDGHKNLTSIKGIGGLSAGILLSIIGDIGDFAEEGKLAAYFGIVLRISSSNERPTRGTSPTRQQAGENHAGAMRG